MGKRKRDIPGTFQGFWEVRRLGRAGGRQYDVQSLADGLGVEHERLQRRVELLAGFQATEGSLVEA